MRRGTLPAEISALAKRFCGQAEASFHRGASLGQVSTHLARSRVGTGIGEWVRLSRGTLSRE